MLDQVRAALALYAKPENWHTPSTGFAAQYDPEPSPVAQDGGQLARAALAALETPVARPDVSPVEEVANIECHIRILLSEAYLESIGANVQALSHRRELHHRVMRILADLSERLQR